MIQEQIEQAIAQCWQNYSGLVINHGTGAKERCFTEAVKALLHDFSAALTAPSAGVGREEAANVAAKEYSKKPKKRTPIGLKPGEINSDYKQGFFAGADWQSRSASQPGVDLAAAEKHVDKVLEAETTESLTKWMKDYVIEVPDLSGAADDQKRFLIEETCKMTANVLLAAMEAIGIENYIIGSIFDQQKGVMYDLSFKRRESPSLPPDGVQGLVEALEKIVALQISGKVNERVHRIAREALTAYKNAKS